MSEIFHYCGHIISRDDSGRFPKSNEAELQRAVANFLNQIEVSSCYGSLASGGDILLAEAMVNKGASLHLVLPFEKNHFIDLSVRWSGEQWVERFAALFSQAASITQVFSDKPKDENLSFAVCTEIGLGLSLLEMIEKQTVPAPLPQQITIWDQQTTTGIAGTYPDMLRAQALGMISTSLSSNRPFETKVFNQSKDIPIQPLKLVIYDQQDTVHEIQLTGLQALVTYLEKHPLRVEQSVDFNRNLFGRDNKRYQNTISDRALGHIVFHCYAQKNFNNRDVFLQFLLKVRNLKILPGNSL